MTAIDRLVGQRIKRREDPRLITGFGSYVDDVRIPGTLYAAFIRSPHAHAKLNSINIDAARGLEGIVTVLTGEDLRGKIGPIPTAVPAQHIPFHPALALGTVRYVGEPVAVVVGVDPYVCEDAADLIEIDYDPLPAVIDPEAALAPDAPVLHEEIGSNIAHRVEFSSGDIEQAMRDADKVVKFRLVNQRLAPFAMEPRGMLANWNPGSSQLTVWVSTQGPHLYRSLLGEVLGLPEHKIRVIAIDVGGGFGAKMNCYRDEVVTAYLALTLGR
ncbi:MAG: xanthine dehydrogenase family protein molybdopterin-binding subunit, partial [Candidatus Binataceae bacterium]